MDKAIEGTLRSCFANCGQVCLGTERLYVERSIFDEFVARLKEGAEQLVLGDPANPDTNLGPLISGWRLLDSANAVDGSARERGSHSGRDFRPREPYHAL
jgi:acyl-CoA reductase-like NAD-dependent aldehyde dehydrogenase